MIKVGFLGCGKIGKALLDQARHTENVSVSFIQDLFYSENECEIKVSKATVKENYEDTDLIVECATSSVLEENIEIILKNCDLMLFSVTAFSNPEFEKKVLELCEKYNRKIYIPHGAILGMDGIFDGNKVWETVSIETTKNPQSLGRDDVEKTIVFEGLTRDVCKMYPRNVNVHAAVALAGIGFDQTKSKLISDPAVDTNSHLIILDGVGIHMELQVSSFTTGGVTGLYTPFSACGSLKRVLDDKNGLIFV